MKKLSFSMSMVLVLLMAFAFSNRVSGQILKEGKPLSSIYHVSPDVEKLDFTPDFDWDKIYEEDSHRQKDGVPMRAGFSLPVGLDINNSGKWTRLPDGRMMWRLSLAAEGATALGVVFDQYELPEGSELYLYNEGKSMVNGALGSHNNRPERVLSTRVLYGDIITIEYIENPNPLSSSRATMERLALDAKGSKTNAEMAQKQVSMVDPANYRSAASLSVGELMYMYTDVYAIFDGSKPQTGASGACQVDINCAVGDSWQNQKRGVIHQLNRIGSSWYFCSSSLVNNTLQNFIPYVLSAYHCGQGSSAADRNVWQFYFNYERPSCGSGAPPTSDMMTGCDLRAEAPIAGGSDLLLVQLKSNVPSSYNPYFNGWSRSTTASTSGAGIHHPAGDVKKISTYSSTLTSANPNIDGSVMASNSAWRVVWTANVSGHGCTEGGSSGSPLFNSDGLIVGTLTGGSSTCANPGSGDFYGKFSYHWESNGTTPSVSLRSWLDPAGTNPTILQGWDPTWTTDPPVANFSASATNVVAGTEITFTDLSTNGPTQWQWDFGSNAFPTVSNERNPKVAWVTPGTYTVSLTATNTHGSGTETKTNYITVTAAPTPPATNPVTIGTGTGTGLYPFGIDGRSAGNANHVQSVALYTAAEIGGGGIITKLEWYANTVRTDTRNIQIWLKHTTATTLSAGAFSNYITGAQLVYDGTFVPSIAGWNALDLTSNFGYNGTQNLLVIVYTNSTSTSNISSACRYTTSANRHHQWNARNTAPSGNGTVNGNRPNIRIEFASQTAAPVANFGNEEVFFFEGFEDITSDGSLPEGWEQFRTTSLTQNPVTEATTPRWFLNSSLYGFETWQDYIKNGQGALAIGYTAPNYTWAVSPEFTIANTTLDVFLWWWMWFAHNPAQNWNTNFHIRVFSDGVWSTLQSYTGSPQNLFDYRMELNMNSYKGKTIRLAFIYQENDGFQMAIDDILVGAFSSTLPSINVFEGETVTFTDASTNTPILWEWSTPGGTPATSNDQNPTIRYDVAGQYSVTLRAANLAGQNSITKSNYVNVIGRPPIADFGFQSNFWTSSFQPFLQRGDVMDFVDKSVRIPTGWNWTFTGGTPSSSSLQNPTGIRYNSNGSYSVALTASNAHGSDNVSVNNFVLVGGTQEITKIREGESLTYYGTGTTNAQFPGHNQWSLTAYADRYENEHEGTITQVRVLPAIANGTGKNVIFRVWADNNGVPGVVLDSKTVAITSLTAASWNTVVFDSPIQVTGTFYVGFAISYDSPSHNYANHQFTVACVPDRGDGFNTSFFLEGSTWYDWPGGIDIHSSMAILPEFTFASTGPIIGDVNPDGVVNILDVVWFVAHLNGNTPAGFDISAADVNGNGTPGELADLTALIDLILQGAKGNTSDTDSETPAIYLTETGDVSFTSDGTITALQFEFKLLSDEMELELLTDTDHTLAYNYETGKGVIYSMSNTPFPDGKIDLLRLVTPNLDDIDWGEVWASNISHQMVRVSASTYHPTTVPVVNDELGLTVYPNPTSGECFAKFNLPGDARMTFYLADVLGRTIAHIPAQLYGRGEHMVRLPLKPEMSSGVYILKIDISAGVDRISARTYERKLLIVR